VIVVQFEVLSVKLCMYFPVNSSIFLTSDSTVFG